ncbi:MAG TPA: hypothetical protein GXZ48_05620 [Acholeplasmataceae bacterium]|nr:hypothetical protein [Acholeplasmataceae bacterium]
MKKNKLSIYLIKEEFTSFDDIVKDYVENIRLSDNQTLYFTTSKANTPDWVKLFF